MYGMIRYSLTIAASICVAMLAGERAFGQPRIIREAPNGDLFVADSSIGAVHALRVSPGRSTPLRDEVFARGMKQPLGIAFYPLGSDPRWIYIADSNGLVRFRYRNGDLKATGKPEQITVGIPTIHQYARGVAFLPDGDRLYFSVGSARTFFAATGPRTCEGMTVQPATGELSCTHDEDGELSGKPPQSAPLQMGVYRGDHASLAYTRLAAFADESEHLYLAHCAACHQAGGEGLPGVFPPLKGSGVVNKDDATKHIQMVLNGMQGGRAGGVIYAAPMPPFADTLSDAQIAGIIDYERSSWGNHGKPVTATQVAAERVPPK
jgi:mono/diheme cytochrome c family protein